MSGKAVSWALVATVKTAEEKILAFLAWHLNLGAERITLCFDDPDDPALTAIAARRLPKVRLIACDDAHWQRMGTRPDRHQNRQAKNARMVYRQGGSDWLGHIDIDEFLWPEGTSVGGILARLPGDQIMCRMEPFEAMQDPALPDDICTARQFRGRLKPRHAALRVPVLGAFADIMPEAMLSHTAGKVFFRSGVSGLSPRLHGGFVAGERLPGPPFEAALRLLHFHAQDIDAWRAALPFRLSRGAYQYQPVLQAWLMEADSEQIGLFLREAQQLTPEKTALLREAGRLIEARLDLRAHVAGLLATDSDGSGT